MCLSVRVCVCGLAGQFVVDLIHETNQPMSDQQQSRYLINLSLSGTGSNKWSPCLLLKSPDHSSISFSI